MITFFRLISFFLFFSSALYAQNPPVSPWDTTHFGKNPTAGHFLKTRGIQLYYEVYGNGEPLLLIHGNGGSMTSFLWQIPYFSKKYQVIAVDSRAQGKSVDTGDSLSFEMMADDFNALLDSLRLDSCLVLGWSDGGINGIVMAIRHPEKVKKLAVTGANLRPDTTAINPPDFFGGLAYAEELKKREQTPETRNTLKLVQLDNEQPNLTREQLKTIRCPSLIIGGDHDIIRPQHTLQISEWIPGSYLWILPNSSHGTLIDHHEKFNKTVDEFFSGWLNQ